MKSFTRYATSAQQLRRIILLIVLGYEAAGCLLGGSLLVIAPDGRFMNMPVGIMHGVFPDFFIPGVMFGMLIGKETPDLQANLPTPYIGIWERINIAAFMLWVVVFATVLLRKKPITV